MQANGPTAEHGDVLHFALYSNALALAGHSAALRQHRDFAGPVIDLVKPEWHERNTPGARDHAADADGPIRVAARVPLNICDIRVAQRQRTSLRHKRKGRNCENTGEESSHLDHQLSAPLWAAPNL